MSNLYAIVYSQTDRIYVYFYQFAAHKRTLYVDIAQYGASFKGVHILWLSTIIYDKFTEKCYTCYDRKQQFWNGVNYTIFIYDFYDFSENDVFLSKYRVG